jgi:hypothetical protein
MWPNAFEVAVADKFTKLGFDVFRAGTCIRLQVKGSRSFVPGRFFGWWTLKPEKLKFSTTITDYWVFVCAVEGTHGQFKPRCVVVPTNLLFERMARTKKGSTWHLYLEEVTPGAGDIFDTRGVKQQDTADSDRDYRAFHEAFDEIVRKLAA